MYKVGDRIIYGAQGVCEITDIKESDLTSVLREYYIISPVGNDKSVIYVPIDNEKLTSKMRKIPSKKEFKLIIEHAKKELLSWDASYIDRNEYFSSIISDGEISKMISLYCTLDSKLQELSELGKGLKKSDERIYKECSRILSREISFIMDTDIEQALCVLK